MIGEFKRLLIIRTFSSWFLRSDPGNITKFNFVRVLIWSYSLLSEVGSRRLQNVAFFFSADLCNLNFRGSGLIRIDALGCAFSALKLLKCTDCFRYWLLEFLPYLWNDLKIKFSLECFSIC